MIDPIYRIYRGWREAAAMLLPRNRPMRQI
jgi:hypothetical protein